METIVNKKRIMAIICLIVILGLFISPVVYGDTDGVDTNAGTQSAKALQITQTYPEDHDTKLQVDNTGIKLFFDGNVIDKSVWKNNQNKYSLVEKKSKKEIKLKAYSSAKSGTDYILVVVNQGQTLKPNTDYIFTVDQGIQSKEGAVLQNDVVLNYKTVDTQGNSRINMLLMGLMVVGMIVMTVVSNKRQAKKDTQKKEEKVNPYKVAREKGKSVEEVMEKLEKDKARKAKRSKNKEIETASSADEDESDNKVYTVKKLRRVSDGGSTYKTGRKAEAEKKAKEEANKKAKGTTNPKKSKKKGKKKK